MCCLVCLYPNACHTSLPLSASLSLLIPIPPYFALFHPQDIAKLRYYGQVRSHACTTTILRHHITYKYFRRQVQQEVTNLGQKSISGATNSNDGFLSSRMTVWNALSHIPTRRWCDGALLSSIKEVCTLDKEGYRHPTTFPRHTNLPLAIPSVDYHRFDQGHCSTKLSLTADYSFLLLLLLLLLHTWCKNQPGPSPSFLRSYTTQCP